jgi:hypothetical protein
VAVAAGEKVTVPLLPPPLPSQAAVGLMVTVTSADCPAVSVPPPEAEIVAFWSELPDTTRQVSRDRAVSTTVQVAGPFVAMTS